MTDTTARDQIQAAIDAELKVQGFESSVGLGFFLASAAVAAGCRPPARVIDNPEDLDALPEGTVVVIAGVPWKSAGMWWQTGQDSLTSDRLMDEADESDESAITVVWTPGDTNA